MFIEILKVAGEIVVVAILVALFINPDFFLAQLHGQ